MERTYIIAEIGTGHGGDPARADALIAAARDAGADCAKFQYVIADEIVHPAMTPIKLPGGATPLHERFRALERPEEFYRGLAESCRRHGIDFLCSPFGMESARALRRAGIERFKIASPEINHVDLLREVASYGAELIISTGVSRLTDIERALDITGRERVTLLHCITSYPAPESEYNLRAIDTLTRAFGVPVGLSDHTLDPELVPLLAVTQGAGVIEKHFTMSRAGSGLDDPIALDPAQFARMTEAVRGAEASLHKHARSGLLQQIRQEYGAERVDAALGTGRKDLAAAEAGNYRTTRRSLLARDALEAGHTIAPGDLVALRSESLAPGLEPAALPELIGARLTRPLDAGQGIQWADVVSRGA